MESNAKCELGKQVTSYGILYVTVICVFVALIALRMCFFDLDSSTKLNCTLCDNPHYLFNHLHDVGSPFPMDFL